MDKVPARLSAGGQVGAGRTYRYSAVGQGRNVFGSARPQSAPDFQRTGRRCSVGCGVYPLAVATACMGYRPQEVKTCAYIGRTGVDYDAAILLQYPDAYAALTIGFDLECRNDAIVVGETGRIVFDPEFWRAESVKLYDRNGGILDVFCQPHPINGYEYEISEVHRALDAGRLESRLIPQRDTLATMRLLDACRAQWGLYYDEETLKSSGNE